MQNACKRCLSHNLGAIHRLGHILGLAHRLDRLVAKYRKLVVRGGGWRVRTSIALTLQGGNHGHSMLPKAAL